MLVQKNFKTIDLLSVTSGYMLTSKKDLKNVCSYLLSNKGKEVLLPQNRKKAAYEILKQYPRLGKTTYLLACWLEKNKDILKEKSKLKAKKAIEESVKSFLKEAGIAENLQIKKEETEVCIFKMMKDNCATIC
ncbi:MAG: hypothetical protein EOM53_05015 [Alphaproteobacteria bacterium]|nr:hypothetical protein [Alphaproteobacteria bacterium]